MNRSQRFATAIVTAIALVALPLLSAQVSAAPSTAEVSWSVTPGPGPHGTGRDAFSYSTKPGVEITDSVIVTNHGTKATTFNIYAADGANDFQSGGFALAGANKPSTDLGSWITLPVKTVTIPAGKGAHIPVVILVPSNATPGDHTAGIIASIIRKGAGPKRQHIQVEERVAARVYLHVAGAVSTGVTANGLTSGFSPSLNPFGTGTSTVNYSVKNTGNLRVDVLQKLTITGPFGITLGTAKSARLANLLPGQAVQEHVTLSGIAPLLLLWSKVTLSTAAPTDTVVAATTYTDTGSVAAPVAAPKAATSSSESLTTGVPWTFLVILVLLAIGAWLLVRYVRASRDRVYLAIDAAANEAREQALAEQNAKESERAKEPVA